MRKLLPLTVVFLLIGCVSPLPKMPDVSSHQGKECVRQCQRDHSLCTNSCQGITGISQNTCVSQCNQKLGERYQLCSQEEQG